MSELQLKKPTDPATQAKKKVAILSLLVVALVFLGVKQFGGTPTKAKAAASTKQASSAKASAAKPKTTPLRVAPIAWPEAAERDPFADLGVIPKPESTQSVEAPSATRPSEQPTPVAPQKPAIAERAKAELKLTSTVIGKAPVAIINGEIYQPGDRVSDFVIVEIHHRRIVVERDGVRVELGIDTPLVSGPGKTR